MHKNIITEQKNKHAPSRKINYVQSLMYEYVFPLLTHNCISQQQGHKSHLLFPFCLDYTSQAIIFYLYKSQKIALNVLPGAFFPTNFITPGYF